MHSCQDTVLNSNSFIRRRDINSSSLHSAPAGAPGIKQRSPGINADKKKRPGRGAANHSRKQSVHHPAGGCEKTSIK